MGHKAKWEYFGAVYERYHKAERETKHLMLNEFCLNSGYHRKYAIRILNEAPPGRQAEQRRQGRRPRYGPQVLSVLAAIWEAAGYPWSVRLKALLPNWMPWIRKRKRMTPTMEKQLLGISARQIDRRLQAKKSERKRRIYGRTQPGSLLKHHIPVKKVETINDLYRHELRLWQNLYLPSVKLVKKVRVGSKVRRIYDAAQTPLQRVLACRQAAGAGGRIKKAASVSRSVSTGGVD